MEEQLVTSANNTLAVLEDVEKQKEEGLFQKYDDFVERSKEFRKEKRGKIDQFQEEMAQIEEELDKKQEMFNKLKEEFENNPLPEAVEVPTMTLTQALAGKDDDDEFTELPKDDDPDDSNSVSVRLALLQKE